MDDNSSLAAKLLVQNTVKAALGGGMGSSAAALAHSVLKAMPLPKLAGISTVVLTVALAASATVALVYRGPAAPEDKNSAIPAAPKDADAGKPQARTDAWGDPLPEGAIARLGTVRFRHAGDSSLRAIEVLELAGTKEAREVLATLANGAEGARLTEQAKAARDRLANARR